MKSYVVYGVPDKSIEDVVRSVNAIPGFQLTSHESSYRGRYYRSGPTGEEHILVQPNYVAHENEWIDDTHQEFPILIYVNETTRADLLDQQLRANLPTSLILKREDL